MANANNLQIVFNRLVAYAEEDEINCEVISEYVDRMLDSLLEDDFFGSEGQCDPRGDRREGDDFNLVNDFIQE